MGRYNVVWNSPSKDASGVMPIGNGDIAAGVYALESGDLDLLLAKNDAYSYMGDLFKTGRLLDKLTAGKHDGFLWDAFPRLSLRVICGNDSRHVQDIMKPGVWQHVVLVLDGHTPRLYLNGQLLN